MNMEQALIDNSAYLYNFSYRLTNNKEQAEDIVQETLFSAWKAQHQLKQQGAVRAWLRKICLNTFLQRQRKKGESQEIPYQELSVLEHEGSQLQIASAAPASAEELVVDEAVREIQDGCFSAMANKLTLMQRVVFALKDMFGISLKEITGFTQLSLSAVKALLNRARNNMINFYAHHCQWVLPENSCRCTAWLEFAQKRKSRQQEINADAPKVQFNPDQTTDTENPTIKQRVLKLFSDLPAKKPDNEWYENMVRDLKKYKTKLS